MTATCTTPMVCQPVVTAMVALSFYDSVAGSPCCAPPTMASLTSGATGATFERADDGYVYYVIGLVRRGVVTVHCFALSLYGTDDEVTLLCAPARRTDHVHAPTGAPSNER